MEVGAGQVTKYGQEAGSGQQGAAPSLHVPLAHVLVHHGRLQSRVSAASVHRHQSGVSADREQSRISGEVAPVTRLEVTLHVRVSWRLEVGPDLHARSRK